MGAAVNDGVPAARPGTVLGGKYRVERELARGGMGAVVVARHLKLDRLVAIKLLHVAGTDAPYAASRFSREARAAARLRGEHVVRILDLDEAPGGAPYLVMELLEGTDLDRVLAKEGPVAPARAVDWALQACSALAEAHERGIVHRDVKPSNLFRITSADGTELIKLLDFGISKVADDELQLTRTAASLGSPLFMSPEQLLRPRSVDARTDVWSLGVTLYRLLSNRLPFDAADASSLAAQIAAVPPTALGVAAPSVPPELERVVMRCLEKEPSARWQSVLELAEALEPFRSPGATGTVASVRLAIAQAKADAAALARDPEPASPLEPAPGSLTLSHDVPREPSAPAVGAAREEPPSLPPGSPRPSSPRPPWRAFALAGVSVMLVGGAAVLVTLKRTSSEAAAHHDAAVDVIAHVTDTAVSSPSEPPARLPQSDKADAGAVARARPTRNPQSGGRDPADLEIK